MERRHGRRPSQSPSFASTIPDSSSSSSSSDDRHASTAAPIDLEKGVRSPQEIHKEEKEAGITETEVDLNLPGQRKKFLGIPLPWTGKGNSSDEEGAAQAAASMKIIDPSPEQMTPFSTAFVPSSSTTSSTPSLSHTSNLSEALPVSSKVFERTPETD